MCQGNWNLPPLSAFRSLFNNEKSLLELYNALHGTNHSEQDTEIIINTLDETLVLRRKNVISFLLNGKLVVMLEHQSSVNENLPFRFLRSISRIFEDGILDKKAIYRRNTPISWLAQGGT